MENRMRDYMTMRGMRRYEDHNPHGRRDLNSLGRRSDSSMMKHRNPYYMEDIGHGGYYEGEFRGTTGDRRMRDMRSDDYRRINRKEDYGFDYIGRCDMDSEEDCRHIRNMDYGEDYDADYEIAYGGGKLNPEELNHWEKKLHEELDKSERDMMSREKIVKRAKNMGIKFDQYSEDELAVATLMMYTDYCPTLGKASIDMYIKLAKDFLEDKDAGVRYGEKLAAYFDHIANV